MYIEYCVFCSKHRWCTYHNEEKYTRYYRECCSSITAKCPEVEVCANLIPPNYQTCFAKEGQPWRGVHSFPRIGAFEVYFRGRVLFSKLESRVWPNPSLVGQTIWDLVSNKTQVKTLKTVKTVKTMKKIRRKKRLVSCAVIGGRSNNKQRKSQRNFTYLKGNELESDKGPNNKIALEDSIEMPNDRKVTQKYELALPINRRNNKKIAYRNKTGNQKEFFVWSNHPNMIVKENIVVIHPEERGKFELQFQPVPSPRTRKYYLYVDLNGEPCETIEILVLYS